MKRALFGAAVLAVAGCTSVSVDATPQVRSEGLGSDLRVFFDDSCLPPPPLTEGTEIETRSVGFLADLAIEAGSLLFKTLGKVVQEAGAAKADRSTAMRGGFMFVAQKEGAAFNRRIGCVNIVRGGFGSGAENFAGADPTLVAQWRRLGLKRTPTLYALVRLAQAKAAPGYMSGELLSFNVSSFERNGRRGERDFLIVMDFERPKGTAYVTQGNDGSFVYAEPGAFARGVFKLTDVRENQALDAAALNGLDTGLMPIMAEGGEKDFGAFNLLVDVIEFKRGDPQLADLGALLRDSKIEASAKAAITRVVDREGAARTDAAADFDAMDAERKLVRTLDAAIRDIRPLLAVAKPDKEALAAASDALDDAKFAISRRVAEHGWVSPEKADARLTEADTLIKQAQTKLAS